MLLLLLLVLPPLAFFLIVSVLALVKPESVLSYFGITSLTRDGRNEIRAMYGGLSLGGAIALVLALVYPALGPGILVNATLICGGIAAGRLISVVIDGKPGRYPWLFLGIEVVLAVLLFLGYWMYPVGG